MEHFLFMVAMSMLSNHGTPKSINCDGLMEKYHTTLAESPIRCFEANSRMYKPLTIKKNRFFYYFDCMIGDKVSAELQFRANAATCEVNIRDQAGDLLCTHTRRSRHCDNTIL